MLNINYSLKFKQKEHKKPDQSMIWFFHLNIS